MSATVEAAHALLDEATGSPVGFCEYDEARAGEIDHAVVRVPGPIPRDVDTWADYVALVGRPAYERSG